MKSFYFENNLLGVVMRGRGGRGGTCSIFFHLTDTRQVMLWVRNWTFWARLGGHSALGILLSLSATSGIRNMHGHAWLLNGYWEFKLRLICLHSKLSYLLNQLPQPCVFLLKHDFFWYLRLYSFAISYIFFQDIYCFKEMFLAVNSPVLLGLACIM